MTLKSQLQDLIMARHQVSYGDLVDLAIRAGYKTSAMDARLREICQANKSITPMWDTSKRGTRYINGYRYVPTVVKVINEMSPYKPEAKVETPANSLFA